MRTWWCVGCVVALALTGCRETDRVVAYEEPPIFPPLVSIEEPAPRGYVHPRDEPGAREPAPPKSRDGVPQPLPGVYEDHGEADEDHLFRGLIGLPIRNLSGLEQAIREIYDPADPRFRRYMTRDEWMSEHAPTEYDLGIIREWIEEGGMKVTHVATNRLLMQFTGTVGQFNRAFGGALRVLERNSRFGNAPPIVYGLNESITVPRYIRDRITTVVAVDLPADPGPLAKEGPSYSVPTPSENDGRSPRQIAAAYDIDDLHRAGYAGQGQRIGVVVGAGFRFIDLDAFWRTFGITRALPEVVVTSDPPATRYLEPTIDIQWAGAMAPAAHLVVYQGADARNTSVIFAFNEAIGRGEVDVITDSFAHREDAEPTGVGTTYALSARMGAALGITIVAASGDSGEPDVPSNSPWVTAVGGTYISMDGLDVAYESAWVDSGCGLSERFVAPWWQEGLASIVQGHRGVADVALNAGSGYWTVYLREVKAWGGTSFSSPAFAGLIASLNSGRAAAGKPRVGWLNSILYTTSAVQAAFRDITSGTTETGHSARVGWDLPTGWGAPKGMELLQAFP